MTTKFEMTKFDTVDQSMTSAITQLHPIALLNKDAQLRRTFIDTERGVALAGFRRQVANFGVLLTALHYGPNNEIKLGERDYRKASGLYDYMDDEYIETNVGLLGTEVREDYRERVDVDVAQNYIDTIKERSALRYEVELNPNTIMKFIDSRERDLKGGHKDKKINFGFTAGLPQGTAVGVAERDQEGRTVIKIRLDTPMKGLRYYYCYVANNSQTSEKKVQLGRVYLVKPVFFDKKNNVRYVNVMQQYYRGIRMAIQHLNNGIITPNDPGYILTPNHEYGVKERTIATMAFTSTQNMKMIMNAPMLTFDLDMFYSLMKTLSGYPIVTMKFKDSSTGVYFTAEGRNEYQPHAEAIIGPTILHVRGRTYLP
ncbi:hypothetical protein AAXE64_27315 [Priestia megaterium]